MRSASLLARRWARRFLSLWLLGLLLSHALPVGHTSAQVRVRAGREDPIVHPWQSLPESLRALAGPLPLSLFAAAALSTPPLVLWADRPVQDFFQGHNPLGHGFGEVSLWVGGSAPLLLPAGLYLGGLLGDSGELASAGSAALQAGAIQLVVVTMLKWLTDRAGPFPGGDPAARRWHSSVLRDSDDPLDFNFNPTDLRWGLRFPSGHTASNVAMVAALSAFYPRAWWLPVIGYPLAIGIGVGMIEGDYHWLSDVVAGALIGYAIGWAVGRHVRAEFDARRRGTARGPSSFLVHPGATYGTPCLFISGQL